MTSSIPLAAGEQFAAQSVTTAGFAVGMALLIVEHWRWYKGGGGAAAAGAAGGGGKDPKELIPFWFGVAFGILMVACPAGLLGTVSDALRWAGNGAGGWVMSTMTGQRATTTVATGAPGLNQYGALVVTALVLVLFFLRKQFAKLIKGRWKKGVLCGVLLCITTGTAAVIAQATVGGANDLGQYVFDAATNGTFT
ncbi:hypothetical protein AB0H77_21840 [Streptomyces sp. NPDC050844]|uniref:hypothetical protein n=1 Tax=Streptomyces sp. NPDC050844 TaxID=3155790 RepID=UPI0033CCBF83